MRYLLVFSLLILFFLQQLIAQPVYKLNLRSSMYVWENDQGKQKNDFYQGINFYFRPTKSRNFYFTTYSRFAHRGEPGKWQEKVYNAYLVWSPDVNGLKLRLGRQFVYHGVIQGSVDGLKITLRPSGKWRIYAIAGSAVPTDRALKFRNFSDNKAFGIYGSYKISSLVKTELSYFQKNRGGQKIWEQAGLSASGAFASLPLYYVAQVDFNLKNSTYQAFRLLMEYYKDRWTFHAELNNQKPRIYEDFLYNMFEIEAYSQLRSGVSYNFGKYQANFEYLLTLYPQAVNNKIIGGLSSKWGSLNLLLQDGHAGKNIGVFGQVNYTLFNSLTLYLQSSYYTYERYKTAISEDATAFTLGFDFRPWKTLSFGTQLQQMKNRYYNNDFRALFRVKFRLNN